MADDRYHDISIDTIVAAQLGRKPYIGFELAYLCDYGWPAVIRNSPYDSNGTFNPNRYYLTCPILRKKISTLEDEGLITQLQNAIGDDEQLQSAVRSAQEKYAREWLDAAKEMSPDLPSGTGGQNLEQAPRIAGARGDLLLKCLHAHYAFYLVREDHILGKMIDKRVGMRWCHDERCRRLTSGGEE